MSSVRPVTSGPSAGGSDSYRIDANTVRMPNLTREDARHRSGMLRVDSYDVTLDLTDASGAPTERTFRSRTTLTFSADQPGGSTFLDVIAEHFHEVSLNGQPVDVSGYQPVDGIVLPELAEHNVVVVDADLLYTTNGQGLHRFVDPLDGEVYLYSQFETTDSKRMYACFDQPDLKATFTLHVTAPAHWQVVSNGAVVDGRGRRADQDRALRDDAAAEHLHHRAGRRPLPPHRRPPRRHRPRAVLPRVTGRAPRQRRAVHRHQAGFRLVPPELRAPLPVRQVRPVLRARVQRRRDGERRLRDQHRGLHLHQPGDRRAPRAPGHHRAARDGPHVVRQPGHHAVVRGPLAERVVRRVGRQHRPGARHRVARHLDHLRQYREGLGVPAGPVPLDPPGRLRDPRRRGGRGQLRRHHLRQGRQRAQAAGRLRRAAAVPGRASAVLRRPRLRQHHPGRPAGRAERHLRPGAVRLGEALGGDQRHEHPVGGLRGRRRRPVQLLRGAAGRAARHLRRQHPAPAPAGHRAVPLHQRRRRRARAAGAHRPGGGGRRRRADRDRRAGRPVASGPGAAQRRRPDLLQAAAGRAQPAHPADRRAGRAGGFAGPHAVLVGGLGDGARRCAGHPALRSTWSAPRPAPSR